MSQKEPIKLTIKYSADKKAARDHVQAMARELGFEDKEAAELALVVSELAANLVEHARGGEIVMTPLEQGARTGMQLESRDLGPGIADTRWVMGDGSSSGQSLGYGLGTVNRLMDEMHIESPLQEGIGTRVVCRKWIRIEDYGSVRCPLTFGAATRPLPGFKINGDAFYVRNWGSGALAVVIDGLGHGQFAHRASQKARNYIERHYDQTLDNIFLGVSRECVATRGAVMAAAHFHGDPLRLSFASVGNIEARFHGSSKPIRFPVRRGVLGMRAPRALVSDLPWGRDYGLVLHSDGLSSSWTWKDFPGLWDMPAQEAAERLMHALAKDHDDATVVVVKGVES